jgi:hypothetical protein
MEKFIEVYDDILNPKLVDLIENLILTNTSIIPFHYREDLTNEKNHPAYNLNQEFTYYQN